MNRQQSVRCSVLFFANVFACSVGLLVGTIKADTFGSGASAFEIEFVKIGAPGNPGDRSGEPRYFPGSVPYEYQIGKYEISEQMIDKANALGALGITKDTRGLDKPATSISWFEAARFVNWLNSSTGHTPAYKFVPVTRPTTTQFALWEPGDVGYDPDNLFRNKFAKYFLPSVDEWYKAAYYDPVTGGYFDYQTGSNVPPLAVASGTLAATAVYYQDFMAGPAVNMLAGGLSPFGTMAQGGGLCMNGKRRALS